MINHYSGSNEGKRVEQLDVLVNETLVIKQFYDYIIRLFSSKDLDEIDKYRSILVEEYLESKCLE